jgi:hypothetical protein
MPREGGYGKPAIFIVVIAVIVFIEQAFLSLIGLGYGHFSAGRILLIVVGPVLAVLFSFVGGAILFVIWRLLGSQRHYETAYRCAAYGMGIAPVTTVMAVVPYLGTLAAMAWGLYLIVIMSVEVHSIEAGKAWIVFGIIYAIVALTNLSAQMAARRMERRIERWQERHAGPSGEMSPEEAGRMVGQFLKGLQEQTGNQQ